AMMGFVASEPLPFDAPAPPAPSSPGGRERRRGPVAVAAALVVVGGLAGGALGAEVMLSRTPAPVAANSPASSSSVAPAQTPTSAAALYKQAVAGIVTITTEVARRGQVGEGTGSGIVLDQNGDILTNAQGQVVGVNDSIESPVAGNVGVGFAIPVNVVKQLLASLEGGANQ